ncbi:sigma-54-dependent Fis family transcriptional regulator [Desulfoluna limicola]|uniref:Sigma-54-dependent Fis family transcriptional regulator n=2 Tax=Desulfoluna limicola TaxID=2810562 RepID=A0ABM7PEL9_9BACT|nr:sigma-54-dependent Fis family transcriptional regulator [Desulfoluna limicola]
MTKGDTSFTTLRPEIRKSWIRCRKLGIDPNDGTSPTSLSKLEFKKLQEKKKELIAIAVPFMKRLFELISHTGFGVVLTDENGYIIEIMSIAELTREVAKTDVNFKPGVRWREEDVGTNGIDLILRLKRPYQISGAEHFCRTHHPVSCIGAPIFNAERVLVGSLIVTGYVQAVQEHTKAMIIAAVEVISDEIMIREKNKQLTIMNNRLTNILMSMSDGVIVTDSSGRIQQINPVAKRILGRRNAVTEGTFISDIFEDGDVYIRHVLGQGKSYTEKEVTVKTPSKKVNSLATANAIKDCQDHTAGGVIVLSPKEKQQKLIKRYASTSARFHFENIIGQSTPMRHAIDLAIRASENANTILLEGESGTGKEVFAQAIHNHSHRRKGPFVAINCGALPRELIASELFGYVEGTFTGAKKEGRPGKFELANGGTIFLDEIAEMPLDQQVSLLRALQERAITRIGSISEIPIDVVIICATNKDLQSEIMKNNFRLDLYYRLNVISIKIPPLRERIGDIPILVNSFIESMGERDRANVPKVEPEVIAFFNAYHWPGNVRELHNVIEKMLLYCDGGQLGIERLPHDLLSSVEKQNSERKPVKNRSNFLVHARENQKEKNNTDERERILFLLGECGGNVSQVARELGINRSSVYRKLKRYKILA